MTGRGEYVAVVGGVNMDIGGRAYQPLVSGDSNPGSVTVSLGGVGRNIAHNLRLLGERVGLLTAYGEDLYGQRITASCGALGIDISHALRIPEAATSTYLYIASPAGEMELALSDMEVCRFITPDYLAANLPVLQNAAAVVADTNIPAETLRYLAENCQSPLFCDPVSTNKAIKLLPILSRIHTLKPNRLEAELLTGVAVNSREDAAAAAEALLEKGVQRVFLSMGAEGVLAADRERQLWLPTLPGKRVNTTGCGDAFMAALVWAYMQGADLRQTALAGLAAGAIAMESEETICPAMSAAALNARMNNRKEREIL